MAAGGGGGGGGGGRRGRKEGDGSPRLSVDTPEIWAYNPGLRSEV